MKNELLDKGIILPSGEIGKDKINLVAGAITQRYCSQSKCALTAHLRPKEVNFLSICASPKATWNAQMPLL